MITEILCRTCNTLRPVEEFYKNRKDVTFPIRVKSDVSTECKQCHNQRNINRYHANPIWASRDNYARAIMSNYKMTIDDYDEWLAAQDGHCKTCPATEPGGNAQRFCVDHDHACPNGCSGTKSCGECIRGLLCVQCNFGLGAFKDNPEYLLNAIAYLIQDNDGYVAFLEGALNIARSSQRLVA